MAKLKQIKIQNFNYKRPSGLCNICGRDDKPVVEVAVEIGEVKGMAICDECSQGIHDIHTNMKLMLTKE